MIKTKVLILKGLARESRHWETFPEILQTAIPRSEVVVLDLPGIGTEAHRSSPDRMHEIVLDLRGRWRAKSEVATQWGVIGVSLGGMVVLEWMHLFGEDFKWGVVINSSCANLSLPQNR